MFQNFLKYLNLKNYQIIQLNENESNIKEFNKCLMKVVNHKVLLSYFNDLSKKYKSSTLWSIKGSLSKMLLVHGINLKDPQFSCIDQFLKDLHRTHKSKKSSVFSREEMDKFLIESPDEQYLQHKLVALLAIYGGLRKEEAINLTWEDVVEEGDKLKVTIKCSKQIMLKKDFIIMQLEMRISNFPQFITSKFTKIW